MAPPSESISLRIIYITPGGIEGRGGMGMMARYLMEAYKKSGNSIQCRVLDSYGPGPFYLMPLYFLRTYFQLMAACLLGRVDVVHIHMSHSGSAVRKLALLQLAHLLSIPTILHIHGSEFQVFCDRLSGFWRSILIALIKRASRVVVIGSFWQRYLVDKLGVSAERVVTAHNGVPLPPAPHRVQISNAPCRIVALGALGQRKGTPDLLKALATPLLQNLDWRAVIAGNGAVEQYRLEAASLGLESRVELPGWVGPTAAQEYLRAANIFVLPSYNEGLPVAILEAMAAELPVVTTPVGAIPDLVLPDETGFLVDPGSIDGLALALYKLIADADLRARFGKSGRQRIAESFTIEATANRLATLYRSVAKRTAA